MQCSPPARRMLCPSAREPQIHAGDSCSAAARTHRLSRPRPPFASAFARLAAEMAFSFPPPAFALSTLRSRRATRTAAACTRRRLLKEKRRPTSLGIVPGPMHMRAGMAFRVGRTLQPSPLPHEVLPQSRRHLALTYGFHRRLSCRRTPCCRLPARRRRRSRRLCNALRARNQARACQMASSRGLKGRSRLPATAAARLHEVTPCRS